MEEERRGRLAKPDERVALDDSTYLDENLRIRAMWSALRAVNNTIDAPVRRPFRDELCVLRHASAARDDAVVGAALDALEAGSAADVGVEPLADLASWFMPSTALVPDEGAPCSMREKLYESSKTARVPSGSLELSSSSAASDGACSSNIDPVVPDVTLSTVAEMVWRRQTAATVGAPVNDEVGHIQLRGQICQS